MAPVPAALKILLISNIFQVLASMSTWKIVVMSYFNVSAFDQSVSPFHESVCSIILMNLHGGLPCQPSLVS